jgi:hypothetical protein
MPAEHPNLEGGMFVVRSVSSHARMKLTPRFLAPRADAPFS